MNFRKWPGYNYQTSEESYPMVFPLTRRSALRSLSVAALVGGGGSLAWLAHYYKKQVRQRKEQENYQSTVPSPSTSWVNRVRELHGRIDQGDFAGAAESAGHLTNEALRRADHVVQSWLAIRGEYHGLLPRVVGPGQPSWNYKDSAADMYCHFVIEASLAAPRHLGALREILEKERRTRAGLPGAVHLDTGKLIEETLDQRIFGAVEYAKDGLLPILERIGPTEWLDRMHEIVDAIIAASPYETRHGHLPSLGTEKNGELLQVLARLYHRERRLSHLAAARVIADAYTKEILPFGGGLPVKTWSVDANPPSARDFRLRDHDNEIIAGLAEWVVAESVAPGSRAEEYRGSIERMMDTLLDRARDSAGAWLDYVLPAGAAPPPPSTRPLNDNWGYLTSAYVGYALSLPEHSARRQRYLAEAARSFAAAIQYRGAAWESGRMDGYADSIEGALYLVPFLQVDGAARWIDEEIGVMLAYQQPNGFVGGTYLDGNYVRTAVAYALFRTQGARPDPWHPGLRFGAVMSPEGLHIAISSEVPWTGRVIFDRLRHRDHLNLPYNYPRLNGWTEWFTAHPEARYDLTRRASGQEPERTTVTGRDLIDGIEVNFSSGAALQMTVVRRG
jgi:hypothetical protein